MTKQEIGQILKVAREAKGFTQKQVAELIGRKQQIIGHWETGYAQPDANTLFELCDIYGLSIDDAFGQKKMSPSFTADELALIEKFRALDVIGREVVLANLELQTKRIAEFGPARKRKTIPLINGILDGTIETKYAAKQEQKELEKESTADLANQEV